MHYVKIHGRLRLSYISLGGFNTLEKSVILHRNLIFLVFFKAVVVPS